MAPIGNIGDNLNPADRIRPQDKLESSRADRARGKTSAPAAEGTPRADSIDISPAGRELANVDLEISRARQELRELSARDEGRVAELRARIEEGEFDRPEVSVTVAETIVNLPQFRALSEPSPAPRSERVDVAAIAERVNSGQFNTDQVLEQVAVNILNDIGTF